MTPFEIFLLALNLLLILGLVAEELRLRAKNNKLVESIVKLTMDKLTLQDQLADATMSPSETDGFIKFLSESREWAFSFIEDVQSAIQDLQNAMQDGNEQKITEAYEKLIGFLPEKMNND